MSCEDPSGLALPFPPPTFPSHHSRTVRLFLSLTLTSTVTRRHRRWTAAVPVSRGSLTGHCCAPDFPALDHGRGETAHGPEAGCLRRREDCPPTGSTGVSEPTIVLSLFGLGLACLRAPRAVDEDEATRLLVPDPAVGGARKDECCPGFSPRYVPRRTRRWGRPGGLGSRFRHPPWFGARCAPVDVVGDPVPTDSPWDQRGLL